MANINTFQVSSVVFVYFQVEQTGRYIIFKFWELQNTFFYSLNMKKYKIGKYCTVFILKSSSIVYSIHCGTIFLLQFIGQMIYGSIRLSSIKSSTLKEDNQAHLVGHMLNKKCVHHKIRLSI